MAHRSAAVRFFELEMGPHDMLFEHLSARDLVRLMRTCRRVYRLVRHTCFDITRLLVPFFGSASEVARFQRIQAATATVISGSIALQFFNRKTYRSSDLDIYTHRQYADSPVSFFIQNGYTFDARQSQQPNVFAQLPVSVADKAPSYLGRGIADVLDFHKGEKKIQLIIGESTPMETILSFHSTCVMNIITHENAYALYPRTTFIDKNALIIETVGAGQEAGRQKYIERGWPMTSTPSVSNRSELGVRLLRWIGDGFTWTIRVALRDMVPVDMSPLSSWQLDCDGVTTQTRWTHILSDPTSRLKYVLADSDPQVVVDSTRNAATDFALIESVTEYRQTLADRQMLVY